MKTKICSYNIKWFEYQFNTDNTLKTFGSSKKDKELQAQRDGIIATLNAVQPDILGIVEAPNTTTTVGSQSTVVKLNNFLALMGWVNHTVMTGYISPGRQELAFIYDHTKFSAVHSKGGSTGSKKNPPFDEEFFFDTDDDAIKEVYEFYRPPLEVEFTELSSGNKLSLILVHCKSKGVFTNVDLLHLERESIKNRKKLFAECSWVRKRVEEWIDDNKIPGVIFKIITSRKYSIVLKYDEVDKIIFNIVYTGAFFTVFYSMIQVKYCSRISRFQYDTSTFFC